MKKSLVLTILCLVFAVQAKAGNILNFSYGKDNSVLLFFGERIRRRPMMWQ